MNTCIDRRFPSYFPIMFHIFSHIYSILVHSQIFHICSHICSHLFSHDIDFPICFPYLFPHRNPSSGFPRQPRPLGHVLLDAAQRLLRRRPMAAGCVHGGGARRARWKCHGSVRCFSDKNR